MDAEKTHPVEDDLQFVRRALDRDAQAPFPRSIALLWAAIALAGFPLLDFAPRYGLPFWAFAGPAGFALTLWLAKRSARAAGEEDRAEAGRWSRHWLGVMAAIALIVFAAAAGKVSWETSGATILLVLAVAYYAAGVHLHRGLLLAAGMLALGYLLVLFVDGRTWTWIGVATAAALIASTLVSGAPRRA